MNSKIICDELEIRNRSVVPPKAKQICDEVMPTVIDEWILSVIQNHIYFRRFRLFRTFHDIIHPQNDFPPRHADCKSIHESQNKDIPKNFEWSQAPKSIERSSTVR